MAGSGRHLGYVLKRFPRISETFVAAEIIELERQGERVTVFAISRPDEPFSHAFLRQMKADVVYLPYRPAREPRRVFGALFRVLRTHARGWLGAASMLWPPSLTSLRHLIQATVLRDEMRRAGITHAHAHFATSAARLANVSWQMGGPSYSVTAHAKDIYHRQVRLDRLRDKLGSARFVATVSEANRAHLTRILGDDAHVTLIPNAVDLRRLYDSRTNERAPGLVLTVARLVEKKGIADLVDACGRLSAEGLDIRLEIVGDGPERETLERIARRTGARVVFLGALPNEAVVPLYRRASVFSLPCVVASTGDRDGLPTSVLEAMALGAPVVSTAVNGLRDVVLDEITGLIVPEHDPAALAAALRRVLTDRDLARRLADSARRHVQTGYSLERSVATLRQQFPAAA